MLYLVQLQHTDEWEGSFKARYLANKVAPANHREKLHAHGRTLVVHSLDDHYIWPGGCNFGAPYLLSRQLR